MHGNDRNPALLRCQGFLKIQHLLVLSAGWIPERGCAWPVRLLGWLVGLFLSYSFHKFNGTPLFSIRVNPELVARQGKLVGLPLGSWGRTDSGHHCPHAPRQEPLSCPLEQAPLLPYVSKAALTAAVRSCGLSCHTRWLWSPVEMCLKMQKLKETQQLDIGRWLAVTMPGAEAQITAGCVMALVILFIFVVVVLTYPWFFFPSHYV